MQTPSVVEFQRSNSLLSLVVSISGADARQLDLMECGGAGVEPRARIAYKHCYDIHHVPLLTLAAATGPKSSVSHHTTTILALNLMEMIRADASS